MKKTNPCTRQFGERLTNMCFHEFLKEDSKDGESRDQPPNQVFNAVNESPV